MTGPSTPPGSRPGPPPPAPFNVPWDHLLYAGAFLGILLVFLLALWVDPDPGGIGTHTRLKLPPCGFYLLFGKPCPSCGMTTAFAWMVRGDLAEAWRAQPAGVAVFLATLALWLYLPGSWWKRRPFLHLFDLKAYFPTVIFLIVFILAVWAWRLAHS